MADDYLIRVTTVDRDTVRVALEGSHKLLHQVLTILLEPLGNTHNGAAPPTAQAAKPPRRHYTRRGRPKKADHPQPAPAKGKTVSSPPMLEKTCHFCGNHFSSKFSGSRYCSERCRAKAHELQPLPRPLETETLL
jgi:hypothetical protein